MPSWRDDLRECSFRGVRCLYRSASIRYARRLVEHQYPNRDEGDVEDLGRATRQFSLELYLLDSERPGTLNDRRDALLAVLDNGEPGTLVHPYHGSIEVYVKSVRESYSTQQGGTVRLSVDFVKAASKRAPTIKTNTAKVLARKANTLEVAAKASFCERFLVFGQEKFVRLSALSMIGAARDALGLADDIVDLIGDVVALADALFGSRDSLAGSGMRYIRDVRSFNPGQPSFGAVTQDTQQRDENRTAVITIVKIITITASIDTVVDQQFPSYDDAVNTRDDLLDQIDELAKTADDATYNALVESRIALVEDVDQRAGELARLTSYTPQITTPAVLIAWQLYQDPERGSEVASRNRIVRPGFVPGGERLEVLDA